MNLGKLGSLTTTSINSQISLNSPISLFYNAIHNLKIALPLFKIGGGDF